MGGCGGEDNVHNGGQRLVREQIENKGPTSSTYPSSLTKTDERNDIWQPRAIVPGRACEPSQLLVACCCEQCVRLCAALVLLLASFMATTSYFYY